ncbi:DUF4815 domain-containing protein [Desulfovibrio sp. ZJ200]|uniref:DUF4815 domain-containing protein n=1 Tax=Desulfovibrio sp. ZJ200 TaxID=2709792 RepID=UPI0013ED7441|nr:DUF4815 domain-containing protein [Desulfovibrio sp. ZJ200]
MSTMPDNYYDNFDASKNYEKLLFRDGYTLQGAELNEAQSASLARLRGVADALFKDGDIISDASIIVDKSTGKVRAGAGSIYLRGAVRNVAVAEFVVPTQGSVAVGVRLHESVISELNDPALYNPAIGSRGEGEPGAWRLRVDAAWGWDGDNGDGEFYPVYAVDDGELRAKEAPPTLDSFTRGIARYDRDSTGGGSYVVSGLTVRDAGDADGHQVFTVAEGRARVNGYGVDLPTSRRLTYPATPDLRVIDTEVHIADSASMTEGGQRLTLAHPPLWRVTGLRITTRKTVSLTHGSYSGCADALPDTAVVSLVECRQGETVYAQGADYKKNGDKIDWLPSGAEPATGSTYSATYDCVVSAEALAPDADGFSVEGAVPGSNILISYEQALPRLDRLALTAEGQFQWIQGVASEVNARAPEVPPSLLPLATVAQTWRDISESGGRRVLNDGVRVVPFSETEAINRRIEYILREVSRQRLEADVFTRESGARAGLFVDPLLNDDMRDQGLEQTAAIIPQDGGGVLTLPVAATATALSTDMAADRAAPLTMPWTPRVLLSQPLRTGSMRVNPYQAFDPLPATVTLSPALDRWTETETRWTSPVTRRFERWTSSGRGGVSTSSGTQNMGSNTTALEYLRQIDVAYAIEGFGAGEQLDSASFDGIPLSVSGTADAEGRLSGTFRIPAKVSAGAKTVTFRGKGGSRASAVFVGQGELTVTTLRQVNTITTVWVDPLAQTFVPDRNVQLGGCDLWFTACGGDARLQIREVQNGVPTRAILAEARIPRAAVALDGNPTRVLLDAPLSLSANMEYAVVVLCDDAETALGVAELSRFDAQAQTWVTSQPYQVGALLSSSNGSTWTVHQEKDLTFRLLEAVYNPVSVTADLGAATLSGATDLMLLALAETPTARTRVEYELTLPDGESLTVAAGQPLRLGAAISGAVRVTARLAGEETAGPVLWPGTQLVGGAVAQNADYYSRSIPATGATRAVLVYDALIPSGATVTPMLQMDGGEWLGPDALVLDGATQQGDGLVEYRFRSELSNVNEIKIRLSLTGASAARPQVRNIRLMAVV